MSNSNYTDITILLDKSSSMRSIRQATIDGINSFINSQKNPVSPGLEGRRLDLDLGTDVICKVTLVTFSSSEGWYADLSNSLVYTKVWDNLDILNIPILTQADYVPNGGTPLIDAFMRAIEETEARISNMPENEKPGRVMFVAVSDGEENTSRLHNRAALKDKILNKETSDNWQFIYQGANQDAIQEAASFGISRDNALDYTANDLGATTAFASMSDNVFRKRSVAVKTMSNVGYTAVDRSLQDEIKKNAV